MGTRQQMLPDLYPYVQYLYCEGMKQHEQNALFDYLIINYVSNTRKTVKHIFFVQIWQKLIQ